MKFSELLDAPTLSPTQIADKHNVELDTIEQELQKGIAVEKEHTSNDQLAREIALDHLAELPDYYSKLDTIENE